VATLSYSYSDRTVWIETTSVEAHPMTHDLCLHHTETLVLPRGWTCRDLRSVAPVGGRIEPRAGRTAVGHDRAISA
jgi:hypothetical protein